MCEQDLRALSTQSWTRRSMYSFYATSFALIFADLKQIFTEFLSFSAIIHNIFEEPSVHTLNTTLHESVNLVPNYPPFDNLQQLENGSQMRQKDETKRIDDWGTKLIISDNNKAPRDAFSHSLCKFEDIVDARLGPINVVKLPIELTSNNTSPLQRSSYEVSATARRPVAKKKQYMLREKAVEPTNSECICLIVFAPTENGWLRSSIDYCILAGVRNGDSYPLLRIHECIDSVGEARIFPFNTRRRSEILADWSLQAWQIEKRIHNSARTLPIYASATPLENVTGEVSMSGWRYVLLSKFGISLGIPDNSLVVLKNVNNYVPRMWIVLTLLRDSHFTLTLKQCWSF